MILFKSVVLWYFLSTPFRKMSQPKVELAVIILGSDEEYSMA